MSLSSRSIRSRSSAFLGSNNNNNNTQATSNTSQPLFNSNSSTYTRSIYDDDSMIWNESSIHHSTSSNSLSPNPTTPPKQNILPSNASTTTTTSTTTTSTTNPNSSTSSSTNPSTNTNTVESLISLANKRITTLVYLKQVHQGKVHWFNTILLSRTELERWFDHSRMSNRTTRFAILGMSLSSLLDITNLQDFLKAMIHLLHELETIPNDNYKPKISNLSRGIFKPSKSARKSAGGSDYSITLQDSGDYSFLYTPNIPFDLDYFEVWITLSDILVEVYQKMINFILPSAASSNNSNALNNSSNNLTSNSSTTTSSTNNSSNTSIGNNNNNNMLTNSGPIGSNTSSVSSTPLISSNISMPIHPSRSSSSYSILSAHQSTVNHHHLESISRIDSKLKKFIVILTKELDGMARTAIREELALLDPMLSINPSSTTTTTTTTNGSLNINEFNQNLEWD